MAAESAASLSRKEGRKAAAPTVCLEWPSGGGVPTFKEESGTTFSSAD